jgi:type VI secretion system protein ImpF
MAELTASERLQPSLLDRLLDNEPHKQVEPPEARLLTKPGLRAAVLRDLAWLFNTTNLADQIDAARHPEAFRSVLNYGLPSMSGSFASNVDTTSLEAAVRYAILTFEPRIIPASLQVETVFDRSVLDMHNQIGLIIHGLLWAQPVPLEIVLRTQIDLEEGGVTVTEIGR